MVQAILNSQNLLDDDDIQYIVRTHDVTKYDANKRYFNGDNPTIVDKTARGDGIPDNRIVIPYGRKIALTTTNYLFTKDVEYKSPDEAYLKSIQSVHYYNDIDSKNKKLGCDLVVHGKAFKLFYTIKTRFGIIPAFSVPDYNTIIPIYDYSIEPQVICAIRYYTKPDGGVTKTFVEVYYNNHIDYYILEGGLIKKGSIPHAFNAVPISVYGDDAEVGIFDPVKKIIDAIDLITSTNMNEIQRFELAYLVLKGQKINSEDVDATAKKGIFELDKEATLEYLKKEIDASFHGSVLDFLVAQVHKQSGVPDFSSPDFAAISGIALQYKLMEFENVSASVEHNFIKGEYVAIDLINSILYRDDSMISGYEYFQKNQKRRIDIVMNRNLPEDVAARLDNAIKLQTLGVSQKTLFDNIPMIENPDDEIKAVEEEKQKNMDLFMGNQNITGDQDKNIDEEDGDNKTVQ